MMSHPYFHDLLRAGGLVPLPRMTRTKARSHAAGRDRASTRRAERNWNFDHLAPRAPDQPSNVLTAQDRARVGAGWDAVYRKLGYSRSGGKKTAQLTGWDRAFAPFAGRRSPR